MKKTEIQVLDLFTNPNQTLTSKEISEALNKTDPSGTLRDLLYFEYLILDDDGNYKRTSKVYDSAVREKETRKINHKIALNKIFAGSFLIYNLGHEIINFIKDDHGQRYIYLNPWGERSVDAGKKTEYVFHIIESPISTEKRIFEIVAVSEVDHNAQTYYSKNKDIELLHDPIFHGHTFYDIFNCGNLSDKAHSYSFKASKLLKPRQGLRVLIKTYRDEAKLTVVNENEIVVEVMANPQHNVSYANADGKKTYTAAKNEATDLDVLYQLVDPDNNYFVEDTSNLSLDNLDDEQCYAVISGRAHLEVSTSNQIAYFLQRDKALNYLFLHDFLGITSIREDEEFEIVREKEKNIDLLFKSNSHVIVVENKIDSRINNVKKEVNPENGKHPSQLSKYYDYVEDEYHNVANKLYFVLAPEYNEINRRALDTYYDKGDKYVLKTYTELFNIIKDYHYAPLGNPANGQGQFLFDQFKKSIEYLTWSNAMKHERTAYIRLKQRLEELDSK